MSNSACIRSSVMRPRLNSSHMYPRRRAKAIETLFRYLNEGLYRPRIDLIGSGTLSSTGAVGPYVRSFSCCICAAPFGALGQMPLAEPTLAGRIRSPLPIEIIQRTALRRTLSRFFSHSITCVFGFLVDHCASKRRKRETVAPIASGSVAASSASITAMRPIANVWNACHAVVLPVNAAWSSISRSASRRSQYTIVRFSRTLVPLRKTFCIEERSIPVVKVCGAGETPGPSFSAMTRSIASMTPSGKPAVTVVVGRAAEKRGISPRSSVGSIDGDGEAESTGAAATARSTGAVAGPNGSVVCTMAGATAVTSPNTPSGARKSSSRISRRRCASGGSRAGSTRPYSYSSSGAVRSRSDLNAATTALPCFLHTATSHRPRGSANASHFLSKSPLTSRDAP